MQLIVSCTNDLLYGYVLDNKVDKLCSSWREKGVQGESENGLDGFVWVDQLELWKSVFIFPVMHYKVFISQSLILQKKKKQKFCILKS